MVSQPSQVNRNVTKSYISLGSNATSHHGNSADTVNFAITCLSGDSVNVMQISHFYRTPAFPKGAGPDFINAVIELETILSPTELLAFLHKTETEAGRNRTKRWGPRTLDLDIISFGELILPDLQTHKNWVEMPIETQLKSTPEELIVPHPRIQDRGFVLIPLRDVAPDWAHPVTKLPIDALISAIPPQDLDQIKRL
jgi:2-amino-4-hydroxy-6-hydroxymethyldihydropteridine diphosphokinase